MTGATRQTCTTECPRCQIARPKSTGFSSAPQASQRLYPQDVGFDALSRLEYNDLDRSPHMHSAGAGMQRTLYLDNLVASR